MKLYERALLFTRPGLQRFSCCARHAGLAFVDFSYTTGHSLGASTTLSDDEHLLDALPLACDVSRWLTRGLNYLRGVLDPGSTAY